MGKTRSLSLTQVTLSLLALFAVGARAQTPPYPFFPPPGYNCSAGPPAQIPFASTANKLLCTSLLTWNNSTDVLNVGAGTTPGTFSVGQLDAMVVNGVTVPIPGFAINSNIQGVIENHSYVAGGPTGGARYYGVRSRGTLSAPAIVQSGDNLSSLYAAGYNGSNYSLGAQILLTVDGTPGASAMPGAIDLLTSPAGSQVPTSRFKVNSAGAFLVNGAAGSAGNVLLSGGTGAAAFGTLDLSSAAAVTNNLPVTHGGTGLATLTAHGVLLGEGTANLATVAAMAADTLLQGQGVGADPAAVAVNNCGSATQALSYSTTTHAFGCQSITGSTTFANPSGLIGLTAVNGVASTADRSDSTHALDQGIAPTWTAVHTFSAKPVFSTGFTATNLFECGSTGVTGRQCDLTLNSNASTGVGYVGIVDQAGVRYGYWGKTSTGSLVSYESDADVTLTANNGADNLSISTAHALTFNGFNMVPSSSTFISTYTGFVSTPTCTSTYYKIGTQVTLFLCAVSATSNATTFTMTGLPAALQPAAITTTVPMGKLTNNTSTTCCTMDAVITAGSGTITFENNGSTVGWTASGTKGQPGTTVTYLTN